MSDYETIAPPPRPRSGLGTTLLLLLVFLIGAAATLYVAREWAPARRWLAGAEPSASGATRERFAAVQPQPAAPAVASPATPAAQPALPEIERRLFDIDTRLSEIDARAARTAGNADRAEGLLIAIAARRALDRGLQLGYIESLLRERFGGSQPQAVATVIAAAQRPVLLGDLKTELDEAAPALVGQPQAASWWQGLRRELSGLIVVRRTSQSAPAPADRLARASSALVSGRVEVALAEIARLPGRDAAGAWIARARRYAAARDALDRIETAALLQPRAPTLPSGIDPTVRPIEPTPPATSPSL
jgi:hypothetical protein